MNFLEQVVADVQQQFGNDIGKVCFVLPSRRARLFLRDIIAKAYQKTMWAPKMLAIQDFVQEWSGWQFPENLRLVFELYEVYQAHVKDLVPDRTEAFEQFWPWGEMLLKDFDEIDRHCVDAKQLFTNIRDLKEIDLMFQLPEKGLEAVREFWGSVHDPGSEGKGKVLEHFLATWEVLAGVYEGFRGKLQGQHMAYSGMAYRALADQLQTGEAELDYVCIVFVGFNALSKSEERIMDHLLREGKARVYWDADKSYMELPSEGWKQPPLGREPGNFVAFYHNKWKEHNSQLFLHDMAAEPKDIYLTGVPLQVGMAAHLGNLLVDEPPRSGAQSQAAILADPQLLFPVRQFLPNTIEKLNLTMGFPLKHSKVYAFLQALATLLRSRRQQPVNGFAWQSVLSLLAHPYLRQLDAELHKKLHDTIVKQNLVVVPQEFFQQEMLPDLVKEVFSPPEDPQQLPGYVDALLLNLLEDAEEREESLEAEFIYACLKRFNQLQDILLVYKTSLSTIGFIRLLREMLKQLRIPFEGEPLEGFQIMGFLETRVLDFEKVYVLGLNEGVLPITDTSNSFIPYNLRKGFGLPTYEERDSITAYHFFRFLQRAKEVHLIYDSSESGSTKEPSRYILQIRHLLKDYGKLNIIERQVSVSAAHRAIPAIHIPSKEEIRNKLHQKYGQGSAFNYLSATSITTYLMCSLRYYFRYVEGIKETEEIEESMAANTFGSVLHLTMERLYAPYVGKEISPQPDINELKKRVPMELDRAFADENVGYEGLLQGKNLLLKEAILQLCLGILEQDAQGPRFFIRELENGTKYGTQIESPMGPWRINGTFDRLDYLPDREMIRIIDYKTGRADIKANLSLPDVFKDSKYKEVFQGFLYAWLYRKTDPVSPIQVGFYAVRKLSGGPGYIKGGATIEQAELDAFEAELKGLVGKILREDFKQTEDEAKCRICPYKEICNRGR